MRDMQTARALGGKSATLADCVRLWTYLKKEYMPELNLLVDLEYSTDGTEYMVIKVVDVTNMTEDGEPHMTLWSHRAFANPLAMISYITLFDLLIVAHNRIDTFFTTGKRPDPLEDA